MTAIIAKSKKNCNQILQLTKKML